MNDTPYTTHEVTLKVLVTVRNDISLQLDSQEHGVGFILPDGRVLKPLFALEVNEGEDGVMHSESQMDEAGITVIEYSDSYVDPVDFPGV